MTLLGIAIAGVASITDNPFVAAASDAIAFIATILFYFDSLQSKPYVLFFTTTDWRKIGDQFQIEIPSSKHRHRRGATVAIYMGSPNDLEQILADVHSDDTGKITVISGIKPLTASSS